jgi:hypothetical protein
MLVVLHCPPISTRKILLLWHTISWKSLKLYHSLLKCTMSSNLHSVSTRKQVLKNNVAPAVSIQIKELFETALREEHSKRNIAKATGTTVVVTELLTLQKGIMNGTNKDKLQLLLRIQQLHDDPKRSPLTDNARIWYLRNVCKTRVLYCLQHCHSGEVDMMVKCLGDSLLQPSNYMCAQCGHMPNVYC